MAFITKLGAGILRIKVVENDFAADKDLERERRQHVESETEAGHVGEGVVGGEIVQDVALGLVFKDQKPPTPIARQATMDTPVDQWVTIANRSIVGFFSES